MPLRVLVAVALLAVAGLLRSPQHSAAASACFPQTGQCVGDPFLTYWQQHGALPINGYPISDAFVQVLDDGRPYTVQYFERVRLELHPENAPPFDVLLGQFGRRIYAAEAGREADPPAARIEGSSAFAGYFTETGHNVSGDFWAYWNDHGGLAQFGYPLTEEIGAALEDGKQYRVQYFERARFERHPENRPPYDVLLGQFGRRLLPRWGPTLAPLPGGQPFADPRGRFTARTPPGWATGLDPDGNVTVLEPAGNAGLTVAPRPADPSVTLEQYRQDDDAYLLPRLRDYQLLSEGRVLVGPYRGYRRTFLHTNDLGQTELIERVHFRAPGYIYVVNCYTLPRDAERYGPTFDGVIGSIASAP
jgi:hypothetical protein